MTRQKSRSKSKAQAEQQQAQSTESELTKPEPEQAGKKPEHIRNPHDAFFRHLFSQADHVRELLQGFVSDDYISLMVLNELTPVDSVYTDTRLSQHESDMIFRVKLKEVYAQEGDKQAPNSVDIYLLFEHKSSPESSVVLQCLRYMVTRWEYDWSNKVRPRAIIPIIFYHGDETWNIDQQFAALFQYVDPQLQKFIPHFEYILINLGKKSDDDIEQSVSSGSLQSGLFALKYVFNQELEERLTQILTPLQKANLPIDTLRSLVEAIVRYLTGIKNRVSDEAINEAVRTVFIEEEELMDSIFDRWAEKARRETLKEAEDAFREEREAMARQLENTRTKYRQSILRILNHMLSLTEVDQTEVARDLDQIDDVDALSRLSDAAWDTATRGFAHFMRQLIQENNGSPMQATV